MFEDWTLSEWIAFGGFVLMAINAVAGIVLTVGGWVVVSKLNEANTDKAKSETSAIYQEIAHDSAMREKELLAKIADSERRAGQRELEQSKKIMELQSQIKNLTDLLSKKDEMIQELKSHADNLQARSESQAQQIIQLENELHAMQLKRK